jgi:hypothetical protein
MPDGSAFGRADIHRFSNFKRRACGSVHCPAILNSKPSGPFDAPLAHGSGPEARKIKTKAPFGAATPSTAN